ncbi:MAG: carboxypeptidase regulatory-like domain-containing protein [Bacteroidales bacterium]|nr:carboxypeptidase regulatory-like domain-containing protein [Bacteroidales bacterium]
MKILNIIFLAIILQSLTLKTAFTEIIKVPEQFSEIQDAIDYASDGDTVLVYPGIYQEWIVFSGKEILVGSLFILTNDPAYMDSTVITYYGSGYVVYFTGSETYRSRLVGFKLYAYSLSNVIYCSQSSPTIENNIIYKGRKWGIRCENNSAPIIRQNIFDRTTPSGSPGFSSIRIMDNCEPIICENIFYGPGMIQMGYRAIEYLTLEKAIVYNNYISDFYKGISGGSTGEITGNLIENCFRAISGNSEFIRLINNTIVNNYYGCYSQYGNPKIYNCIFWGNSEDFLPTSICSLSHCCIENGLPPYATDLGGNIFTDPEFTDPENHDYTIACYSPCVESGTADTSGLNLPFYDYFFNNRIQDGNGDGVAVIDMGFYESYEIEDPGYIEGTVTLSGGNGNVEDVLVGIGATVYPDPSGYYIITICPQGSPYNVTAKLEGYLPQTIENVVVNAGQTTSNIDFELQEYQLIEIIDISPDTILFLDGYSIGGVPVTVKNISLLDVSINNIFLGNYDWYFYTEPDNIQPTLLSPNDSLCFNVLPAIPVFPDVSNIIEDSLFINTDYGLFSILILLDLDLVNIDEKKNELMPSLEIFPNPVIENTTIKVSLVDDQNVILNLFDNSGNLIQTVYKGSMKKGGNMISLKTINYKGDKFPPGMYFLQAQIGNNKIITKKIILSN